MPNYAHHIATLHELCSADERQACLGFGSLCLELICLGRLLSQEGLNIAFLTLNLGFQVLQQQCLLASARHADRNVV